MRKRKQNNSPSEKISDRAWKTATLAATLATRYRVDHGQPQHGVSSGDSTLNRNEADPQLDGFYVSLIRRAEFLLAQAEARTGRIHASQLFDPRRRYTISEILQVFREARWKGLTSENSVRSILKEAADLMDQKFDDQIKHFLRWEIDPNYPHPKKPQSERTLERIEKQIAGLLLHPEKIDQNRDFSDQVRSQISMVRVERRLLRSAFYDDSTKTVAAYAFFGACDDYGVEEGKLWRNRSDLSRLFPL